MFFNSFLTLFDNKSNQIFSPHKFFHTFLHPFTTISRQKCGKITLGSNFFSAVGKLTILHRHTATKKRGAMTSLHILMITR